MTNETTQTHTTDLKPIPFGARLKSAREALGLERKDAAAQLRLTEKVIMMMEKDRYPADLPVTFIRGYIRAYGKLLQIPEYEIKKAIEPIKPKPVTQDVALPIKPSAPIITSGNYFMQFFTYLILFTLLGLVAMWWYSHSKSASSALPENPLSTISATDNMNPAATSPASPSAPTINKAATNTSPPAKTNANTADNEQQADASSAANQSSEENTQDQEAAPTQTTTDQQDGDSPDTHSTDTETNNDNN